MFRGVTKALRKPEVQWVVDRTETQALFLDRSSPSLAKYMYARTHLKYWQQDVIENKHNRCENR